LNTVVLTIRLLNGIANFALKRGDPTHGMV
jgi:hypothetical protein